MKRIFLSAGSLIAIATPIITVVACNGQYKAPTEQQLQDYKDLTSNQALKILENQWQYLVLGWEKGTELNQDFANVSSVSLSAEKETEILNLAKQIIAINIQKNPSYLMDFGNTLLNSNNGVRPYDETIANVYTDSWLRKNGLLNKYQFGIDFDVAEDVGGLTESGLKLLISDDRIDFKSTLLKTLVVREYLTTNKDDWAATYPSKSTALRDEERLIDPENFVLIKEMMSKKYFAKWEIKLPPDNFVNLDDPDGYIKSFADSYAALKEDGIFGSQSKYSERKSQIQNNIFDFSLLSSEVNPTNDPYLGNDLVGYIDIATESSIKNKIDIDGELGTVSVFSKDNYKQATSYDAWFGFIVKDDFITKDDTKKIEWVENQGTEGKLTFVKGLMPIYKNISSTEDEEMRITIDTEEQKQAFIDLYAILDNTLYSDAMDYYTTRVTDSNTEDGDTSREPIVLKILHKGYNDILDNKFHLKFIKEQKVED